MRRVDISGRLHQAMRMFHQPGRRTMKMSAAMVVLFLAFTSILYAQSGEPAIDLTALSLGALAVKTLVILFGLAALSGSVYCGALCIELVAIHREQFGFPALARAAHALRSADAAVRESAGILTEAGQRAARFLSRERPAHNSPR